ncbi:MAG: hypothetical protein ABIO86_10640 [Sphingomonas sp.]
MLEALTSDAFRAQLGLVTDGAGAPAIGPIAELVRACVQNWRSPARARVAAYLHRQLNAAAFDDEQARDRVSDVIDALIDIGDLTAIRLNGKASLVLSRRSLVDTGGLENAMLGALGNDRSLACDHWRYARARAVATDGPSPETFSDWLGPAGYRRHLARRLGGSADGTISEYWATLSSSLQHEGLPLDAKALRAVVERPGSRNGFFGRHNLPIVNGRWSTAVPDGTWCAVRPGRNPNEWHPIVATVTGTEVRALDLYDWDEWNWALLARATSIGAPERSTWQDDILAFEYPVPKQFVRALRLLGGPGERGWTWRLSEAAHQCFDAWCRAEV